MITNTEMTNWIIEKFSGSGGIRTNFSIIQLVISVLVIIIDVALRMVLIYYVTLLCEFESDKILFNEFQ